MTDRIRSGSAPQIHDVSGFAGEHVASAPSSGHGTAGDPRTLRAATDAFGDDRPAAPVSAEELERRIDHQALLLHTAPTREGRCAAMDELKRLHALRSPENVAEVEVARGLR